MSRVNFTQIWSPNEEVTRLQTHIKTTINPLLELPISDGVLLKDLSIATSDTLIDHRLGRQYEGFIVTRLKTNSVVFESPTTNSEQDRIIILKASATATADIYFF
jgi:hypothetical protein